MNTHEYHAKQAYIYEIAYRCNRGMTAMKMWVQWKWHSCGVDDFVLLVTTILIWTLLFCLVPQQARADDSVGVWLTTGEWSRHNDNTNCPDGNAPGARPCTGKYRQNNTGIGVQIDLNQDQSIVAGYYHNSIYRETVYAGMTYTPFHLGDAKFGVVGAMATGYYQGLPAVPIGGAYATYEVGGVGVGLMWLPTVVMAINFKLKVF